MIVLDGLLLVNAHVKIEILWKPYFLLRFFFYLFV